MIFVGDDWAEAHHDVCVMDEAGTRLVSRRLPEGLEGIRGFHALVAAYADDPSEVVVGIETDRGLWVDALAASGYQVYAINPVSVSRYRDRHNLAGAKSDQGDAKVLADLVRTDRHNHRPLAGDTAQVEAVKVLARAHQNLIWARTRHAHQLRSALREYYPAALEAFDDLDGADALAVLERAPSPQVGARLTGAQIRAALKRGGRRRNLDRRAEQIGAALRTPQLAAPDPVAAAFAASAKATVGILTELNRQLEDLEATLAEHFEQHPDAVIYLSMPGLGDVLGARALGEMPTPSLARTTPERRRSPSPQEKREPCWLATSETGACTTPSTNGPSVLSARAPDAEPSTISVEPPETSTTKPSEPSATASSASSTAA
jgi:transposase